MIVATAERLEGKRITAYHGLVVGEAIQGTNLFKDAFALIRDYIGGRSTSYELELRHARVEAVEEMKMHAERLGANGVISVQFDHEAVGARGSMLMVVAAGTAVTIEDL